MANLPRKQVRGILVEEVEDLGDPLAEVISGRKDSDGTSQLTSGV